MNNAALLQNWLQTGLKHHQAGRWDEASRWYGRVRKAAPGNFDAVHLDGTRALQQGRFEEAVKTLTVARRIDPRSALCALRLGIALYGAGKLAEAEAALSEAARLDPDLPEAPFHLGQTLRRLGRLPEAEAAFERAIALKPNYAEAYDRLGALVSGWRGPLPAEAHLLRAVQLDPRLATAWSNLGLGFIFQGRLSEALEAVGKAIAARPDFAHAYAARGLALAKCYRHAAAIQSYGRAIDLEPQNFDAHSARLMELHYDDTVSTPELFAQHLRFGAAVEGDRLLPPRAAAPLNGRKLRVGFLSCDLHRHSVAYFLEPLLAHLERDRFEVYLYHDSSKTDEMSERLQSLAAVWRVTAGLPPEAIEKLLREDALDVLVDLAGHTGHNRLPLYALRLAPVQATYLGYPNTTGLRSMDYRLVDAITDPEGSADAVCTERLVRFAPTAWSYSPPPGAPDPAPSPASGGAPVTFGCFNNYSKINDTTLRLWGRLLAAVPGSRLLLKGHGLSSPVLQADLLRRLTAAAIPHERTVILERTKTIDEHLNAYAQVDVALDTFPYHGTTTTCEALWMGVPVVTLCGDRHASRVGASLLQAMGKPEWIAADDADYIRIASQLAGDAAQSNAPRTALRERLRGSVLMDHPAQAARFGAALLRMWEETCAA